MAREVERTQRTLELLADLEEFIPGGVVHRAKLPDEVRTVFASGKGSRIWDVDGKEYIDYLIGSGPMILGHAHPAVTKAASERFATGTQFLQITDVTLEHARKVLEAVPGAEQIKFTGTGSEATLLAMRLARAYTGRDKVMKFEGAFHGTHDYVAWSTNPTQLLPFPKAEPDTAGMPAVLADTVLIAPYNDPDVTCQLIRDNKDDLACVILDTSFRNIPPKPIFLEELRRCTAECGVLLIMDEVITGFRLAWGGAQEYYGVMGDLTTLGKILGGGISGGALTGPKEIMGRLDPALKSSGKYAMGSGTFSGNPLTSAAGLAMLKELEKPGTYQRLHKSAERLRDGISQVVQQLEVPALVDNEGAIVEIKFTERDEILNYRDTLDQDMGLHQRLSTEMIRRGVFHLAAAGFYVSLAHTDQELDETVNIFESALRAAR